MAPPELASRYFMSPSQVATDAKRVTVVDRNDISGLHAAGSGTGRQPLDYRDASSGLTESSQIRAIWKNTPARTLNTPSQGRLHQGSFSRNPYGVERMRDTISKPSKVGNPVAGQTVLGSRRTPGHFDGPPTKRMKGAISNTVTNSRGYRANSQGGGPKRSDRNFPSRKEEYIMIDDEEDIGVALSKQDLLTSSPDPIILPSRSANSRRPLPRSADSKSQHPSRNRSETRPIDTIREIHRDRKPENQFVADSEVEEIPPDDIEDFDDDIRPGPSKSAAPHGRVQHLVERFEKEERVQHLDLKQVSKPVARSMKPKTSAPNDKKPLSGLKFTKIKSATQGFQDPLCAPSLGTHKSSKSSAHNNHLMLPLEAWSLGLKLYPEKNDTTQYFFILENDGILITCRSPTSSAQVVDKFSLDSDITELWITNGEKLLESPIIQIGCGPKYKPNDEPSLDFKRYLKPGSRKAGLLTFKFLRNSNEDQRRHDGWADSNYQRLVTSLRKIISLNPNILDCHATRTVWSSRAHAAEYVEERDHSEAGSLVIQQSPPQSTHGSVGGSRPKPRPAYKGANGSPAGSLEPVRRSARQSSSRQSPSVDPEELILVYPPSGNGAINITQGDLSRLNEGEYLNDTLIEFGLKLWLNEIRAENPELADEIHVFSSFFYKKLKNKNAQEGYQSVRKWTQKFDLFKKKYLIVPINEHLHWYLAIIYQPEHVLLPPLPKPAISVSTRARKTQLDKEEKELTLSMNSRSSPPRQEVSISEPPSATQDKEEVEEMFKSSCSISPTHSESRSTAPIIIDQKDSAAAEPEPIVVDDDGEAPDLEYPSSPFKESFQMDVDELDKTPIQEISSVTSKPSVSTSGSRADGTQPISAASNDGAIATTSFYGSDPSKRKGKEKAVPQPFPLDPVEVTNSEDDEHLEVNEILAEKEASEHPEHPTTFIFTLDSLGSRHPQAINCLREYLKMEATDKKGIENCSDALGMQANVPFQPNYSDCGLYVLHLTKTFMRRPAYHCKTIRSKKKKTNDERQAEWDGADVNGSRAKLKSRIEALSQEWKKEYATKLEQKNTEGDKAESSDSEVDIVEDNVVPKAKPVSPKRKTSKATRIRG